ncbi:hypothetical protein LZC95_37985 [Pendulispora brunnea]|uniref:SGNH/GDSL hydrolase family protein n=1 Tax=Pendulispora brunnea TaxID=2905690 RepID=A0ABZ2K0G5_9BACT
MAGRWAARHSHGELIGAVARIGVAIALSVGVSELILRWKMNMSPTSAPVEVPATHADARYGWRYDAPHSNYNIVMNGHVVPVAINARGERARTENDLPELSQPTIVFVGESVVLGLGITYEESFPALVGEALGVQIANLAVHAYGDDQSYVRLHDALPDFEHPIAVVQLVFEDLLERNVERERTHLRLQDDGTFVSIPRTPREDRWRLSLLAERLARYQSDEAIEVARTTYRAMVSMAKARGAVPLIVLTNYQGPCLPDETGAPSLERILFEGQNLPYIRVDLDPSWILPNGHPDARASRRLAEAVQAALAPKLPELRARIRL